MLCCSLEVKAENMASASGPKVHQVEFAQNNKERCACPSIAVCVRACSLLMDLV